MYQQNVTWAPSMIWDIDGIHRGYIYIVYSFYFPSEIAMKKFWQYIGDGI